MRRFRPALLVSLPVAVAAALQVPATVASAATSTLQLVAPLSIPYPSSPLTFSGTGGF